MFSLESMKRLFDVTVFIENAGTLIAAYILLWLHSHSTWRTGPVEHDSIRIGMQVSFFCSLSALVSGSASLVVFRVMRNRASGDFSFRKAWAVFSLCVSAAIFLFGLVPIAHG